MATLSAAELTKLREKQHKSTLYLSVLKPDTIVAGRVNEPGGIDRGAREFDFDGGTGTADEFALAGNFQTLWVGTAAGLRDKGKVRIKSISGNQVSGAIYFDENSVDWSDNDYITVKHNYEIWPILPRIAGGIFYKFYDTVYTDQNENVNPVAIFGSHRAFWLEDTDENDTIAANADDGYIDTAGSGYNPNDNDVRFGVNVAAPPDYYRSWLRFATVDVPQNAKVVSAFIRFTAYGNQSADFDVDIYGERSDNPAAIQNFGDYGVRVKTAASVNWTEADTIDWVNGQTYDTPDISTVIQEVIDQAAFVSGNAIQIFIVENAGGDGNYRAVHAKDSGSGEATLYITYERVDIPVDGSNSYAIADGASISSYAWDASQGTFANDAVAGTTLTIVQPGYTWVELQVTDDNGKQQKTYRCYFTHDSDDPPIADFTITSLSGDWNNGGWTLNVDVHDENATLDDFPDGSVAVLWYTNYIDGSEDYVNIWDISNEVIVAGYIERDTDSDLLASGSGTTPDAIISFNIVTPDGIMARKTEMGSVSIEAVASPNAWYRYASWLTCGRAIHHLLKWHSSVLETCDVLGLLTNTLGVEVAEFIEDSLLQRCNSFALDRGIFAKLLSDRLGRLHLNEDIQMFNSTDRGALDTVFSLTTTDLSGEINLARELLFTNAMSFINGLSFDGSTNTPLIAIAPGYTDGADSIQTPEVEGIGTVNKPRQILENQTDANEKVGRLLAAANNPLRELRITLRGNYLGAFDITPYSLGWYGWSVANNVLVRNLLLNSTKWICRRVELGQIVSELYSGEVETRVVLEGESFAAIDGLPGDYPTEYPTGSALPIPPGENGNGNGDDPLFCDGSQVGSTITFDTNTINAVDADRMDDTTAVIFYQRDVGGAPPEHNAYAVVTDWTDPNFTVKAGPQVISVDDIDKPAVSAFNSNYAICAYYSIDEGEVFAEIIQESGGAISQGVRVQVSGSIGSGGNMVDVVALNTTGAIVLYKEATDLYAQALNVDLGTKTITTNTPVLVASSPNTAAPKIEYFGPYGYAAALYCRANEPRVKILAISGALIIPGVEVDIDSDGRNADQMDLSLFDSTKMLASYLERDNFYPVVTVINRSGGALSVETTVTVTSTAMDMCDLACFNTIAAVQGYYDPFTSTYKWQLLDESSTPITTSGAEKSAIATTVDISTITDQSANQFIIAYGDADDSSKGKAQLWTLTECP